MATVAYTISEWDRIHRARYNYRCDYCGGIISRGTLYLHHVQRLGSHKYKDALKHAHVHLDCQNPWYQPDDTALLYNWARLPGRIPPANKQDERLLAIPVAITAESEEIGSITWRLPENLRLRLLHSPDSERMQAAFVEIEHALTNFLRAICSAAGHQHNGQLLSHVLHELTSFWPAEPAEEILTLLEKRR